MVKARRIVLAERPEGEINDRTFRTEHVTIDDHISEGVILQVFYSSIDPAMRGWLRDERSYIPPVKVGETMRASVIGKVYKSADSKFQVGDWVLGTLGWATFVHVPNTKQLTKLDPAILRQVSPTKMLGVLGISGLTAYFGLLEVGAPKAGETVLVSTAAGAVGSIVGQIAKIKGCRVVGITGSDWKAKWIVDELGYDAAINYKTCGNLAQEIRKACPKGVDVYFDNVGGDQLDAALSKLRRGARVVICGAISQYNKTPEQRVGPKNYMSLLVNSARMEGFVVFNYARQYAKAIREMAGWMAQGKLVDKEHIVDGLENCPKALKMLFTGENTGKLIVKIDHPTQSRL